MAFLCFKRTDLTCDMLPEISGRYVMTWEVVIFINFLANLLLQTWLKQHHFSKFHIKISCNVTNMLKYTFNFHFDPKNNRFSTIWYLFFEGMVITVISNIKHPPSTVISSLFLVSELVFLCQQRQHSQHRQLASSKLSK